MLEFIEKDRCVGCGSCSAACPKQIIRMVCDEYGFSYPQVDKESCVECGLCRESCPVINQQKNEKGIGVSTFAIRNKDSEVRKNSSSGGAFSVLCSEVLKAGGIVYGVAMDDSLQVSHIMVDNMSDLCKLRGSKYIQSLAGDVYAQIKKQLDAGIMVYFSGTACQVEGLYCYLGERPENLITQDLICHGVSSKLVFDRYIQYRESVSKKKVKSISFRNKEKSWKHYSVKIQFQDGTYYSKRHSKDEFMRVYLSNYALRPSCYHCDFKGKDRMSDITLADLWGAQAIVPELDDDKGLSWVICHTAKGRELLNRVNEKVDCKEILYENAIKYNMSGEKSSVAPKDNESFLERLKSGLFEPVVKKYCRNSFIAKVKRKLRTIFANHQ